MALIFLFATILFLRYNDPKKIGGSRDEGLNLFGTWKICFDRQTEAGDHRFPGCGCAGNFGVDLHQ
jgi:hypothetical protein